jgi:hypothetical protein
MAKFNRKTLIMTARMGAMLLFGTVAPRYAQEQHEQEARPPQQEQQQQEARPPQQEQQQQEARPPQQEQQQQEARPPQQEQAQEARPAQQQQPQQTKPVTQHPQVQGQQKQRPPQAQPSKPHQPQAKSVMQGPPAQGQQRQPQVKPVKQQQPTRGQQANRPSTRGQRVQPTVQPAVWQQHRASNWQTQHRTWQQRGGYNGYRIPPARFNGYFGPGHGFRIYGLPLVIFGGYPRFQCNGYWFSMLDPWPESWAGNWYQNDEVYVSYSNGGYYLYNQSYPGIGIAVSVSLN